MNKKGFTLIELLAVIVILAIIALIAMPIILNVIETARKGSKESSTLGYVDAVEKQVMMAQVDSSAIKIPSGIYSVEQLTDLKVNIKGEIPENTGIVKINNKGQVTEGWFTYDNGKYKVYYDGSKAVANTEKYVDTAGHEHDTIPTPGDSLNIFKGTINKSDVYSSANVKQLGLKGIAYLDPTNLSATCNEENSVSTPGTKTGCMKFYIYDDSGNTYKMILDHNTTAKIVYNTTTPYVDYENASIKTQVDSDTQGWIGNPSIITAQEVANITNSPDFDGSEGSNFYFDGTGNKKQTEVSTTQGASPYAWLYDYTNECTRHGSNIDEPSTYGYWVNSPVTNKPNKGWIVFRNGSLNRNVDVNSDNYAGIRPVITLNKNQIN